MDFYIVLISIILGLIGFLYLIGVKQKNRFTKYNVPYLPFIPVLGSMTELLFFRRHFSEWIVEVYNKFPDQKFFGAYQSMQPLIFVKDVELIKQITVKEFDSFHDHSFSIDERIDKLFGLGLVVLTGQKWKDMRSTLSPAFTSSKMRHMFNFVSDCAENTMKYLVKEMETPQNKDNGYVEVELKDLSTRFANDTIASAVFGIKVDSLEDSNNFFYEMGKKVTQIDGIANLKFAFCLTLPKIARLLRVKIFSQKATDFFFGIVNNTMEDREKNNIVRPDMIHLLMEAKKGTLKHETHSDDKDAGFATVEESDIGKTTIAREWTQDELAAQAVLFFFAGFETSSTLLCFLGYELALNPDVQKRLQEEIDDVGSKLEYKDLIKMKYMDMVVSETLRKWPPGVVNDRKCNKSFKLPPADDSTDLQYTVEAGKIVQFPVFAIHRDPKNFPDPEKFDPDRFSDENKGNINPYAFMPFGAGPRNCIGSRFALMEAKAFIFYLLLKFDFIVIPKTEIPIKLKKTTFNLHAENGFWIGLRPREA